jgi:hypothetical protein
MSTALKTAELPEDVLAELNIDPETGICTSSVRAASRLCGVSSSSLLDSAKNGGLLAKIATANSIGNDLPESLKPFAGYDCKVIGRVPDTLLAGLLEYYSFDSKAANSTARTNYRAFAAIGIRKWIHIAKGYDTVYEVSDIQAKETLRPLQQMQQGFNDFVEAIKAVGIPEADSVKFALNYVPKEVESTPIPTIRFKSVREIIEEKFNLTLNDAQCSGLARSIVHNYRTVRGHDPLKKASNGAWLYDCQEDLDIFTDRLCALKYI